MTARAVAYVPLNGIVYADENPKGHHEEAIRDSYDRFGVASVPTVDDRTGKLVAGHGRIDALRALRAAGAEPPDGVQVNDQGEWLAPVLTGWASKDDDEAAAYLVADNQTTLAALWNEPDLAPLLARLTKLPDGVKGLGFTQPDVDRILANLTPPEPVGDPDAVPAAPATPVTRPGDVWVMGDHRLLCGDCRNADHVARLIDQPINLAFTSPPYADRRKYDETTEFRPIPPDEYVEWFAPVAANVAAHLADDGSWFVNIKAGADGLDTELYVLDLVIAHVREWGWHFATEFCWERTGVPKSVVRRFKNGFEPVYQFARGDWKMRPKNVRHASDNVPISLGPGSGNTAWDREGWQGGRGAIAPSRMPRRNTRATSTKSPPELQGSGADVGTHTYEGMAYPTNRLPTFTGSHDATGHTAAFPVGLPAWFIRAYTDPADTVLDPFMGSGSTLIAAEKEGRRGYGIEISPAYCDVVVKRWQDFTGNKAHHADTGEPFPS